MDKKILSTCVTGKAGHTRIIDTPQVGGHCGFEGCPFPVRYSPIPLVSEGDSSVPVPSGEPSTSDDASVDVAVDLNRFFDRVARYINAWEKLTESEKQMFVAKAMAFSEQVQRQVAQLFYAVSVASAPGAQGAQSFGLDQGDPQPDNAPV